MRREEILTVGNYISIPKPIVQRRDLSPAAKLVLASLVDHLGPVNETTWPGPATIAEETGLSRNGVQKCLEQLATLGIIRKQGLSEHGTNIYEVANTVGYHQPTELASQQSMLANSVGGGSQLCMLGVANSVCGGSQQSRLKLLNTTTEGTTEATTEVGPAPSGQGVSPALPPDRDSGEEAEQQPSGLPSAEMSREPRGPVSTQSGVPGIDGLEMLSSDQPAPAKAKPAAKVAKASKPKRVELTDDDKRRICQSGENMRRWINWGIAAIDHEHPEQLPPGAMNYEQYIDAADGLLDTTKLTTQSLAGLYWIGVSNIREVEGQPIALPDVGQICRAIQDLRNTMTNHDLYTFISTIVNHWDDIRARYKSMSLSLDEATLRHSLVRSAVRELMGGQQVRRSSSALNEVT